MKEKIAITGVSGKLGRQIAAELLKTKTIPADHLVGIVRNPEKAADLAALGLILKRGDYSNFASLAAAFQGIDVLMFISNTDITHREEQHNNVVDAAKQAGVGRVVYTSVVQSGNDDLLSLSHANTESYIQASGLPYTFLRNNFYMESYVVEVEIAMNKGAYRSPTGGNAGLALVNRTDIARAAAAVLTGEGHVGQVYDLTGPEIVTPEVFAEIATCISGRPVIHQQITWEELIEDYRERGYDDQRVKLSILLEEMVATNAFATVSDDIAHLTGIPAESFLEFSKRVLEKKKA